MIKYSIRPMNWFDLIFFHDVRNECKDYLHCNKYFTLKEINKWFKNTPDKFFICLVNNKRIGYIRTSRWTRTTIYIGMDIHKNFRGRGYSKIFYNMFFNYLKEQGINHVYLEVLSSNQRAYNLYKDLGFKTENTYEFNRDGEILESRKMYKTL